MLLFSNYLFENKMVFSSEFNHIRNDYRNRNETITSQLRQEGNQMHFFPAIMQAQQSDAFIL